MKNFHPIGYSFYCLCLGVFLLITAKFESSYLRWKQLLKCCWKIFTWISNYTSWTFSKLKFKFLIVERLLRNANISYGIKFYIFRYPSHIQHNFYTMYSNLMIHLMHSFNFIFHFHEVYFQKVIWLKRQYIKNWKEFKTSCSVFGIVVRLFLFRNKQRSCNIYSSCYQ